MKVDVGTPPYRIGYAPWPIGRPGVLPSVGCPTACGEVGYPATLDFFNFVSGRPSLFPNFLLVSSVPSRIRKTADNLDYIFNFML
jgi:hypothetical protein